MSRAPSIVPILNPLIRRLLGAGLPFGPNVLLTVRGRSSGQPRTFPIAILELGSRRFVQSPFGDVNWVRNLRASGDAIVTKGKDEEEVMAVELDPTEAGAIYRDALAPYRRSRILRPIVDRYFHIGSESTLEDYVAHARLHPMFELHAHVSGGTG